MFFEQLNKLCSLKGINLATLVKNLSLSSSNQTKWKNGAVPKSDTIKKIADYFGVTTDYLLGNENVSDSDTNKNNLTNQMNGEAVSAILQDPRNLEFLKMFTSLTPAQQAKLQADMDWMLEHKPSKE